MPQYYCYCGQQQNPEEDDYIVPHSCGEQNHYRMINRQRVCEHKCILKCHPGQCPPCKQALKFQFCYCGKQQKQVECGTKEENFECGKQCENILNCNKHLCEERCHVGECKKCEIILESKCYCEKEQRKVLCGEEEFSCEQQCDQQLDCGLHNCQEKCHKNECNKCQLQPEILRKCPCGKNELDFLTIEKRSKCTDPIAVCGMPCKKLLKCKEHYCQQNCHLGECPPCKQKVDQICRCGNNSREVFCFQLENEPYLCQKVCHKKKQCKIHKCLQECCPSRNNIDQHMCLKICNKQLNCTIHNCGLFCHIGACGNCPIIINDQITCGCGKKVVQGPQKCGFKVKPCGNICEKVKEECGHKCQQECHEGECGPCKEPVSKECFCMKKIINTVCHKQAFCLEKCEKVLDCGHICGKVCHKEDCGQFHNELMKIGCGQVCGKKMERCTHNCMNKCHPESECITKCEVHVKSQCECANRTVYIECHLFNSKQVLCDNTCNSLKRFGQLINREHKSKPYFPNVCVKLARRDPDFIYKIESQVSEMIKQDKSNCQIQLKAKDTERRNASQVLLTKHYNAEVDIYWNIAKPFMVIKNSKELLIPRPSLMEYMQMIKTGKLKLDILPFEASIRFQQATKNDSQAELLYILNHFQDQYYLEWSNHYLFAHFWEKTQADAAIIKLKKSQSIFSNLTLIENTFLINEDQKINNLLNNFEGVVDRQDSLSQQDNQQQSNCPIHFKSNQNFYDPLIPEQIIDESKLLKDNYLILENHQKQEDNNIFNQLNNQNLDKFKYNIKQ